MKKTVLIFLALIVLSFNAKEA